MASKQKKKGNVLHFPALPQTVELTEDGVADEFARRHSGEFMYDHDVGKWLIWSGTHWQVNRTNKAFYAARRLCREIRGDQKVLASKSAASAVEFMARSDPRLAAIPEFWDRDPFLLGCPGGAVDLKTGELRKANPSDLITRITSVTPAAPGKSHPIFNKFLNDATAGDEHLHRFLMQWGGYCLTGDTREEALLFIHGPGGNGKSVLQGVLSEIIGDYAKTAAMETFMASRLQRHLTELAMLRGSRLVSASETQRGLGWNESRINQLTGNDPITANFMRQDHFTYRPQFKLTISGNHKPQLGTVNEAARRRLLIVLFMHKPQQPDLQLRDKLRGEYPAILRTMINGCLDWQKNGLIIPDVVKSATTEYFQEQDTLAQWVDESCDLAPHLKTSANVLYISYEEFMKSRGEHAESMKSFCSQLAQLGYKKFKSGTMKYAGIALKTKAHTGLVTDVETLKALL